jgi:NRPS condensation-like uncharacterized protein
VRRGRRGTGGAGAVRFTAAEELACHFDTGTEPCNIHLEVQLQGRIDEAAFRAASIAALTANQRTGCRRARHGALSLSYEWERRGQLDADPVSATTYADADQLTQLRNAFLRAAPSVDAAPPARLLLASGPAGDHVMLSVHHAVMDGLSCLQLLQDIALRYRKAADLPTAQRPAVVANQAVARPAGVRRPDPVPTHPEPTGTGWGGSLLPRRPARIAADHGGGHGYGLHLELLPDVPEVRPFPDGSKATLNEALTAALIMAVGHWNAGHDRPARTVRVTIPVNTRPPGASFAVGNESRLVTVSADPPGGAGTQALLRAVTAQARTARIMTGPQIDRASRGLAGRWCPTPVKRRIVRVVLRTVAPLVVDTVMLTNLGNVPDQPDFGVPGPVTMAFSVPAQMPRGLSVGVITAGGRPQLGVRYNRALMDAAAAARFTTLMLRALQECTVTHQPALINPL